MHTGRCAAFGAARRLPVAPHCPAANAAGPRRVAPSSRASVGCLRSTAQHEAPRAQASSARSGVELGAPSTGAGRAPCCGPSSSASTATPLVEDTTPDNWRTPLRRPGSVVALGKFDALHRGHRALALAAARMAAEIAQDAGAAAAGASGASGSAGSSADGNGSGAGPSSSGAEGPGGAAGCGEAVLLSFSGMGAVLGWPVRLPLTAPQDRGRVLAGWSAAAAELPSARALCSASASGSGSAPAYPGMRLRTLPFSLIRGMSPEAFVALLAADLGAAGVVAGRNYRFGFKAAGDAEALVALGRRYGLRVAIVDLLAWPDEPPGAELPAAPTPAPEASPSSSSSSSPSSSPLASGDALSDVAFCVSYSGPGGSMDGGPLGSVDFDAPEAAPPPAPSRLSERFSGVVSTDLEGEDPAARVSSSRIRGLLECGQVESVEQLLGRKYRLVADLQGASLREGQGGRRLLVPSACFQNQAPAAGKYRTLTRLIQAGPPGAEIPPYEAQDGAGAACVDIELTNEGLELDLGDLGLSGEQAVGAGALLMLDFGACG
ncbi:hypothetical protein HYH03_008652 [Edaphochlamys debaryana]|uniref:FAD synthase n=1 Tax=Edaphochlamys debaryana TaxID=47281 RepID=A0A835Y344_9CHLO|nr:hypothetical protein HYH03_008652 [Edaphochlamys debaryana]|eukprot:KAG2493236.1 hypothetical protein HYH03_008652 [Edaphochlamys debaryana]